MKANKNQVSQETQDESMKIAKATQRPGQTKEQTKIIAQGIEKGIALYKKQQKEKSRLADKAKKKTQREKAKLEEQKTSESETQPSSPTKQSSDNSMLPWVLLLVSWIAFVTYIKAS